MPIKQRTLTLDECRDQHFVPFQKPCFWDGLDYESLTRQGIRDLIVLDVGGALEGSEAQAFFAGIQRLVQRGERTVIVNLADLKRVDSTGFGELVRSLVWIKKASGSMPLVNAPVHFHRLVESMRLL